VKKNNGEKPMYYIKDNHPAIVPRKIFRQVQAEMARRACKRKVLPKSVKTEQGKYSAKYALSEKLFCGECGTPYKRVTWTIHGKKKIVWRCISRLEYGKKFCHNSPSIEEERLHQAIVAALNKYAANRDEVCGSSYNLVGMALEGEPQNGSVSIISLQRKLEHISKDQAALLEKVLADMDNPELNEQLKNITDKKQRLIEWIQTLEQQEVDNACKRSRMNELKEWLAEQSIGFIEYDDILVRKMIEQIEAIDANTIKVKIRDTEVVIEQGLEE